MPFPSPFRYTKVITTIERTLLYETEIRRTQCDHVTRSAAFQTFNAEHRKQNPVVYITPASSSVL